MNTEHKVVDRRYQQAQALLDERRITDAKRVYEEIISAPGDHPNAWLKLCAICSELGEIEDALSYAQKAIAADPGSIEAYLVKARLHYRQGTVALVTESLEEAIRQDPDNPEAWTMLASLHLQNREYDKAKDACTRLVNRDPDDIAAWEMLAGINLQRGNPRAAIDNYRQVLRLKPEHHNVHYSLGMILLNEIRDPAAAELHLRRAIELNPANVDAHVMLGFLLGQRGSLVESALCSRKALELNPDHYGALTNLGQVLREQGKLTKALDCYSRACRQKPDEAGSWLNLGSVFGLRMEYGKAIDCYRKAHKLKPNAAGILHALAKLLRLTGDFRGAINCCHAALKIEPNIIRHYVELGDSHICIGNYDEALKSYNHVLSHDADNIPAIVGKARILERHRKYRDAVRLLEPLLCGATTDFRVAIDYAHLSRHFHHHKEAIALMETVLDRGNVNLVNRAELHFATGRLYEDVNEYEKAFSHIKAGNDLRDANFDPGQHHDYISALIQVFGVPSLSRLPHAGNDSKRPIFIVGMPRSGTSLVEQILASNRSIYGAGELNEMNRIVSILPAMTRAKTKYPFCIAELTQDTADRLASDYLSRIDRLSSATAYVTDKMPTNYLHLGLIELLFPGARVIHCKRDPLDTCVSNYFRNFTGNLPFSYRLDHLGAYYNEYARLMKHWRATLGIPMLEIEYESLVANPEQESRKLIEFCDLDWDANCLRFYETERVARTASYDQVRQPIYSKSVGRWKHYRRHLEPLAAELGYDMVGKSSRAG
jgi:tetratricopeptide (TPR) repeat protein